jgi:hypothetical protein
MIISRLGLLKFRAFAFASLAAFVELLLKGQFGRHCYMNGFYRYITCLSVKL